MTSSSSRSSVEIVAHRGASAEAPENTRAAVCRAWELGADAVEIDVHLSRDGQLVVIHDETLDRTAGIAAQIADRTAEELSRIDVGTWKGCEWQGECVPALKQILATVPAGRRLFVELKGDVESVEGQGRLTHFWSGETSSEGLKALRQPDETRNSALFAALDEDLRTVGDRPESVVLISFDPWLLQAVALRFPQFASFLIVEQQYRDGAWRPGLEALIREAARCGFRGLDLSGTPAVTAGSVRRAAEAGLQTAVWTINSESEARRLIEAGVHALTTDDPRRMLALREEMPAGSLSPVEIQPQDGERVG